MGRRGGLGRLITVEHMHIIDVDELRRAGFIGKPPTNWWKASRYFATVSFKALSRAIGSQRFEVLGCFANWPCLLSYYGARVIDC